MTDPATRMRDSGQSWTDIAESLGISVRDAKARVEGDKRERRRMLAETQVAEDRNGLRDSCGECDPKCAGRAMRKSHENFTDHCTGCTCEEFVKADVPNTLPYWRTSVLRPKPKAGDTVDPNISLHGHVSVQAHQLGVPRRMRPDVQQPRLETLVARARRKLRKGKKLKRHYASDDQRRGW